MTKEKLEKEAYEEAEKIKECQTEPNNEYEKGFNNGEVRGYKDGYRDGAEKRIAELEAQIENLVYLHNEDVNTIKLLNKQIEKMKCCDNCEHDWNVAGVRNSHCVECKNNSNWELVDD